MTEETLEEMSDRNLKELCAIFGIDPNSPPTTTIEDVHNAIGSFGEDFDAVEALHEVRYGRFFEHD